MLTSALTAFLLNAILVSAQPDDLEDAFQWLNGKCPEPKDTMHHQGRQLEIERLQGLWKPVYEEMTTMNIPCKTIKFTKDNPLLNSSQILMQMGQKNMESASFENFDAYLTFNSSGGQDNIAQMQSNEFDVKDPDWRLRRRLERLEEDMKGPTPEQWANYEEMESIWASAQLNDLRNRKEQIAEEFQQEEEIFKKMQNYVLFQVLDTDYDSYLVQYVCHEKLAALTNQFGQTAEDITRLQNEQKEEQGEDGPDIEMSYDMEFINEEYQHSHPTIYIHFRNVDAAALPEAKISELITKAQGMIHLDNFNGAIVKPDSHDCPSADTDVFLLPSTKKLDLSEPPQEDPMDHPGVDWSKIEPGTTTEPSPQYDELPEESQMDDDPDADGDLEADGDIEADDYSDYSSDDDDYHEDL